jgi:Holliday junction resolvasome RuvABC endonuclease subunit
MTRLGLGAIQVTGDEVELITCGMIAHPRTLGSTFNQHLAEGIHQIADDLPRFLGIVEPDAIAMELVPVGRLGSNDALVIAAASSCRLIAYQFGIPVIDLAASTVKKELTGDGTASKAKVRNTILDAFDTLAQRHAEIKQEQKASGEKPEGFPQDIFDAIAISIVGAQIYGRTQERDDAEVGRLDGGSETPDPSGSLS